MEIVDYLETERVVTEVADVIDRYSNPNLDVDQVREVIRAADRLGIKFYRVLDEI